MAKIKTTFFVRTADHNMLNGKGSVMLVKNGILLLKRLFKNLKKVIGNHQHQLQKKRLFHYE